MNNIDIKNFAPVDMANLLEELFKEYGKDKVMETMKSMIKCYETHNHYLIAGLKKK